MHSRCCIGQPCASGSHRADLEGHKKTHIHRLISTYSMKERSCPGLDKSTLDCGVKMSCGLWMAGENIKISKTLQHSLENGGQYD